MIESKTIIDMEKTGNNLRKYAYENGYSVRDIQQYLGLSCPQPIYRWFKGIILPSVDNLLRLSEFKSFHKTNAGLLFATCRIAGILDYPSNDMISRISYDKRKTSEVRDDKRKDYLH